MDNDLELFGNQSLIPWDPDIDLAILEIFISIKKKIMKKMALLEKKKLCHCTCCLQFYSVDYDNMNFVYDLIKINNHTSIQ